MNLLLGLIGHDDRSHPFQDDSPFRLLTNIIIAGDGFFLIPIAEEVFFHVGSLCLSFMESFILIEP